jgi:hypothetical protein
MRRSLYLGGLLLVLVCGVASTGLAALATPAGAPSGPVFTSGPPDTCPWGYTWKDSDHNPGEVIYAWKEISGVGTEITGLADDNGFGPFPIGFNFPYYWYSSNVFYFGSNGYISLTDAVIQSATFPNIPNQGRPNGTIAAMMSDLLFPGDSAHAYYWTNATNDTCIIEYKNVPFWDRDVNWDGLNTFEIILSKPDSSITYQYALHDPGTYDYAGEAMTVGIEDRTGDWGLSWMYAQSAGADSLHAGLAIKFKDWAIEPDPAVYDLASTEVMRPGTKGFFVTPPETVTVWGKISNIGNQTINIYRVFGKVEKNRGLLGWQTVWLDTTDVLSPIAPGETDSIAFTDRRWYCDVAAEFRVMVSCTSAQDTRPVDNGTSNVDKADCHSVTLNDSTKATLLYDNAGTGTPPTPILFGAETGLCNKFTPPEYPAYLYGFGVGLSPTLDDCVLMLWDDDGIEGQPGTVLYADTITPISGLNQVSLDPLQFRIDDGSVYAGVWVLTEAGPAVSRNGSNPFSRQGWELLGGGASNFREMFSSELQTRLIVGPTPGYVSGTVTLNDISDASGVTVKAVGPSHVSPQDSAKAVTDEAGNYTIVGLVQGTYQVIARRQGYFPDTLASIHVTAGTTTENIDFTLASVGPAPRTLIAEDKQDGSVYVHWQAPVVAVRSPRTMDVVTQDGMLTMRRLKLTEDVFAPGLLYYRLYRGTDEENLTTLVADNLTALEYTDTDVVNYDCYSYGVVAVYDTQAASWESRYSNVDRGCPGACLDSGETVLMQYHDGELDDAISLSYTGSLYGTTFAKRITLPECASQDSMRWMTVDSAAFFFFPAQTPVGDKALSISIYSADGSKPAASPEILAGPVYYVVPDSESTWVVAGRAMESPWPTGPARLQGYGDFYVAVRMEGRDSSTIWIGMDRDHPLYYRDWTNPFVGDSLPPYTWVSFQTQYDTSNLLIQAWVSAHEIVGVAEGEGGGEPARPRTYALGQSYPNPLGSSARIEYAVPRSGWVTLNVYNLAGQLVKTLVAERKSANYYSVVWDGTDAQGRQVANGVYFYRLQTQDYGKSRRLLVVR